MSLQSLIRRHGSTATLYRPTRARNAGGASTTTFAPAAVAIRVLLDVPDAEVVQRVFGAGTRCDLRAMVLKDVAVADQDGLSITAGWRAGEHYDIERIADFDQGRSHAHWEIALVRRPMGFV